MKIFEKKKSVGEKNPVARGLKTKEVRCSPCRGGQPPGPMFGGLVSI